MTNKYKIALLLTGALRNYEDTFSSIKQYLLDRYDVDVFFYGVENKDGKDQNKLMFKNLFSPVSCIINDIDFYNKINIKQSYIRNSYYSFYNVFECNKLRLDYEKEHKIKYDIIIRCRLDVFWFRPITDFELNLAKNNILTPSDWSFKSVNTFALSDIFCITNSHFMNIYADLYNHIDEYCQIFKFHPESLCGYHITKNKIQSIEIDKHFIFEYPEEKNYIDGIYTTDWYSLNYGDRFVQHFDAQHNKNRKELDI